VVYERCVLYQRCVVSERCVVYQTSNKQTAMESFGADFVCGTVMGLVATPAKMPFMVVKTRLQAASGVKLGTFQTMALIAKNEGVPALWKGTVPAATRMSLGGAVSLSCFRSICLSLAL